jgi:hypothetical protein
MSVIHATFDAVGTWFGFVSGCVASPSGACVPFLAFLALGAAAVAALVLVLLAYRAAVRRNEGEKRPEAPQARAKPSRDHPRAQPRVNEAHATA